MSKYHIGQKVKVIRTDIFATSIKKDDIGIITNIKYIIVGNKIREFTLNFPQYNDLEQICNTKDIEPVSKRKLKRKRDKLLTIDELISCIEVIKQKKV